MAEPKSADNEKEITRDRLAELLNEDLSREYQAIIGYVVYSQVLKGAEYMNIADQLALHAKQELDHALTISRQIDYLGKMPTVTPKPVKTSDKAKDMLRFDLDNENDTVRNYRDRIRQCEALGEFAMAEQIRTDSGAGAGPSDRSGYRPRSGSPECRVTSKTRLIGDSAIEVWGGHSFPPHATDYASRSSALKRASCWRSSERNSTPYRYTLRLRTFPRTRTGLSVWGVLNSTLTWLPTGRLAAAKRQIPPSLKCTPRPSTTVISAE